MTTDEKGKTIVDETLFNSITKVLEDKISHLENKIDSFENNNTDNIYGNIIVSNKIVLLEETETNGFTVRLDRQPTQEQVVELVVDNENCSIDRNTLIFEPYNYDIPQAVFIKAEHDYLTYEHETSVITLSSENVNDRTINVFIRNIDIKIDGGDITPPEPPIEEKINIFPPFAQWTKQSNVQIGQFSDYDIDFTSNNIGFGVAIYDIKNFTCNDNITIGFDTLRNVKIKIIDSLNQNCFVFDNNKQESTQKIFGIPPFSMIIESLGEGKSYVRGAYIYKEKDETNIEEEKKDSILPIMSQWNVQNGVTVRSCTKNSVSFKTNSVGLGLSVYDVDFLKNNDIIELGYSRCENVNVKIIDSEYKVCCRLTKDLNKVSTVLQGKEPFSIIVESTSSGTCTISNLYLKRQEDNHVVELYGNIIVDTTEINMQEGTTARISIKLDNKPTNNQQVDILCYNDDIESNVNKIIFTPNNYNAYQTFIITAKHDKNGYDNKTSKIILKSKNVLDKNIEVNIKNIDMKYGNIIVDTSDIEIEEGKEVNIAISLDSKPSENQIINLRASNDNINLSSGILSISPEKYDFPHLITVSAPHKDDYFKNLNSTIIISSDNTPNKYIHVKILNIDEKRGNIILDKNNISFNKNEYVTFTVKLNEQPTSNQKVLINVDNDNVSMSVNALTFTPQDYNKGQTVSVTASVSGTATITLSSNGVSSKTILLNIKEETTEPDNNLIIIPKNDNFTVNESTSYQLSYTIQGSISSGKQKEIEISCSDNNVIVNPSHVIVNSTNIDNVFYTTLNLLQTSLESGRNAKLIFSGNGIITKEVNFTINNNNSSEEGSVYGEIVLDKTSVVITDNEIMTIGVKLDKSPTNTQLVNINANNSYIQLNKTGISFNSSNYNTYQYVTVGKYPTLDNTQGLNFSSVITFSSSNVQDATVNVTVNLSENIVTPEEKFGQIVISNNNISLKEGETSTFTVKLDIQPTNNQIINIETLDSSIVNVSVSSLVFTPNNYNVPQTVTVRGIKDTTSYADKTTRIILSSNNVTTQYAYVTVINTDTVPGGSGDAEDNDTYLTLEDNKVRNLVPYLSTYYIKPTVSPNEDIKFDYFVTDYYGRSYTNNSNFYTYKIIVKRQGKSDMIIRNIGAGDHSLNLGSYSQEGVYHFSIVAVDQYGRYSHELFNYVRVQNSKSLNTYNITSSDLASYNIKTNLDKEEREYVPVSGANFEKIENDTQKATVQSAIDNAYNNGSVSSGKYKVFIPMFGASSGTNYKGKTNGWKCLKVKYGSGFDSATFLNECTLNRGNLQKLIDDKAKLGYTKIVLPNATYMIDNNPIDIPNGVTLDLGGATIKMCPITGNGALMMRMTDCTDTHLCNGTIEGDYFAHDYTNSTSNSEWVSGVEMGGSCRYCSIRDLTIKNITGYGLQNSISSTSPNGNTFYGAIKVGNLTQGDIDRKTGQDINCSYRLRSGSVNISAYQGNSDFISMSIHLNYQGNEFSSWNYFMYFYDSANKFIKAISAYQYRQVKIPQNAYYVRIVILGERLKSNWNLHYQFFRVPTHCEFRNVTIDNARCVGMAQGQMKDFLVQDCTITNSGQSSATCSYDAEDGWDGMQDAFFENFRIYDCPNNGFLCCAGHNFCVNNMQSDAIYMWERIRWALIKNSTFDKGCVIRGGGEANIVQHGVTRFINNTVSAPDYTNYLFMNVAKNCTYNVAPKNGILINCIINGNNVSRVVYNNDTNNSIVDDIGTLTDNVDYGSTEGGGSEGGGSGDTGNQTVNVTGVHLNMSTVSLNVGSTQQLIASIQPANATNQNVTWSTTSSSIATVSSTGLVTAMSAGTVTITVTTYDGNYRATCNIIVSQPTTPPSSGGDTGGSGETEFVDGLAVVKYPATPKTNPKYWAALGDSITAGTGAGGSSYAYCAVAGKSIGCQVANYGIPGSCINDGYNTALTEPGYDQAFVNRYDEMGTGYDLVTVLGSVNDHRADSKIGKEGSTDSRDFYGALYVLINGLKQRYPNARIVFITPFKTADWKGTNLYGHTMQDFRNAIVVMCNKYQIEVLDLFTVSQFEWLKGLLNSPSYFYQYDYYHPTPAGHIAIGNYLVEHMFNGTSSGSSSGSSGGSSSGGSNQGTTTTVYGNIISSSNTLTLAENSSTTISITLDKQPTYNQNVYISTSGNIYTSTTTLEFTPSNYNTSHVFTVYANSAGSATITLTSSNVASVTINVTINTQSSSGGSSGGSTSSGITNSNETALTQQYSSSHEAIPNIANPPAGAYNWKNAPRINPDGSFPNSTWNAFGHWMTTYKVEGASYYDNVGLLLQNPKAWIWNSQTNSWDVLSSDFEWGSWYLEDFWDDGNSTIANSVTWEVGVSGNHSTWVKIKQDSTTNGRCFHPWGYQKNWRSNPAWSNNGQPYIVTKIDFKLVKYNESGADNLSNAQLVVNSGGDWWSEVGATWKPDWSTNRDMCVGKYIKATRELKRAWATNLPQNWSHGLPTDGNSSSGSGNNGGSSGSGSSGGNGGGTTTIDGLLPITNVASKQGTSGEWIAFGDSITYGFQVGGNEQAYPARVGRVTSLRVNNYGESGRVVAIGASGATVPNERSFCNYYTSLPSSCAMITVFGGVNDFLLGVPLGSSSSTDKSTFYGALNVLADGLKSRYSSSRIVFFTPIRIGGHASANSAGHTLKDYRNAIVQVCNNKGIEVLDLYSLNSMDADISVSNYMGTWDTTHPNGNGHQVIADYIVSQMLN